MSNTLIRIESDEEFFRRGRDLARAIDRGEGLAETHILSFEDPQEMIRLLSEARRGVFRAVKETPGSITDVAARLHRDRSAVKRDIDRLVKAGLVIVDHMNAPGHGQKEKVRAAADRLIIQSEIF